MIYNRPMNIRVNVCQRVGFVLLLLTLLCVVMTVVPIIHDYPAFSPLGYASERRVALVLGAKTKDDVMSNALRARVDYAIELYQSGQVGAIIFTGGFRDKDPLREQSESELARAYARQRGVPNERIWTESVSTTTLGNVREAYPIVRAQGFEVVALVSDRWHLARAQAMAADVGFSDAGIVVIPAPTPYSVYRSFGYKAQFVWREMWTRWAYAVFGI